MHFIQFRTRLCRGRGAIQYALGQIEDAAYRSHLDLSCHPSRSPWQYLQGDYTNFPFPFFYDAVDIDHRYGGPLPGSLLRALYQRTSVNLAMRLFLYQTNPLLIHQGETYRLLVGFCESGFVPKEVIEKRDPIGPFVEVHLARGSAECPVPVPAYFRPQDLGPEPEYYVRYFQTRRPHDQTVRASRQHRLGG